MRWAKCHAVSCVIPKSRCNFMPDVPLIPSREQIRGETPHMRTHVGSLQDRPRTVGEELSAQLTAVSHEGMLHVGLDVVAVVAGAADAIGPTLLDNPAAAAASSGNFRITSTRERPFR